MLGHPAGIALTALIGIVLEAAAASSSDGQFVPLILAASGLVASLTSLGTLLYTVLSGERAERRHDRRRSP